MAAHPLLETKKPTPIRPNSLSPRRNWCCISLYRKCLTAWNTASNSALTTKNGPSSRARCSPTNTVSSVAAGGSRLVPRAWHQRQHGETIPKDVVHIPADKALVIFQQFVAKSAGRTRMKAEGFAIRNTARRIAVATLRPTDTFWINHGTCRLFLPILVLFLTHGSAATGSQRLTLPAMAATKSWRGSGRQCCR